MLSLDNENLCQIFKTDLRDGKKIFTVKLLPLASSFEYVSDVKKLPAVAIKPRTHTIGANTLQKKKRV